MSHTIRLRGPWHYEALSRTVLLPDGSTAVEPGEIPPPGTIQMPDDWGGTLGNDFFGRVRYRRRFGRPSGLSAADRVELVFTRLDGWASVALGAAQLGDVPFDALETRFDVTVHLQPRNELVVEVELPRLTDGSPPLPRGDRTGQPGGIVADVYLEIHGARGH